MLRTMADVLLCDDNGIIRGSADREEAHAGKGLLHRAFSIFLFRKGRRELLIQQRSSEKKLFPLIWANTCCSHLRQGETDKEAGEKRLREELGIECPLKEGFSFVYRAEDPRGNRSEYEFDRILLGTLKEDAPVRADPREVNAYRWAETEELTKDMHLNPLHYAPWFHLGQAIIMRKTPASRSST